MPLLPTRKAWSRDRLSLLGSSSPPVSPKPFGTSDPNVVSMFTSVHVAGPTESIHDMKKSKPNQQQHQVASSAGNGRHSSGSRYTSPGRRQRIARQGSGSPTTGALQFVPAYEEATATPAPVAERPRPVTPDATIPSNTATTANSSHQPERGIFRRKSGGRTNQVTASSSVGNKNNSTITPPSTKINNYPMKTPQKSKQTQQQSMKAGSTVSATPKRARGTRIAKLASMFTSRAVVKSMSETPATVKSTPSPPDKSEQQLPNSPPRSESSTGYVAWPGTQDKRGATVVVNSSYEESDVGKPNLRQKDFQKDLEEGVDRELTSWMNDERSVESNTGTPTSPPGQTSGSSRGPSKGRGSNEAENRSDFHLATAVANAKAAAASPMAPKNNSRFASGRLNRVHKPRDRLDVSTPLNSRISSVEDIYGDGDPNVVGPMSDPWGANTSSDTHSSADTSFSKTSSAYFSATNPNVINTLAKGKDNYELNRGRQALLGVDTGVPQPPTEAALALNDHYAPPHRVYNAANTMGFMGLLDKTKDVPNLLDGLDSDSTTSKATSTNSSTAMSSANRSTSRHYSRGKAKRRSMDDMCEQIREDGSSDVFDKMDTSVGPGGDASIPESDVFDGISHGPSHVGSTALNSRGSGPSAQWGRDPYKPQQASGGDNNSGLNLVMLGGGLTTIQTTADDFSNRMTANEFDENLTNSDYDQYGFAKIPGVNKMITSGRAEADKSIKSDDSVLFSGGPQIHRPMRTVEAHTRQRPRRINNSFSESDSGSSLFSDPYRKEGWGGNVAGDLSSYYVHPDEMKLVLKEFRNWCNYRPSNMSYDDVERQEDATKAFALSEMRSRIMEKDIERGLERRGGTTVVDDLVLTPHNRAAHRVRDAIIVSKAWRDGASPHDAINTSLLTRRPERAFFIKRYSNQPVTRWTAGRHSREYVMAPSYRWEEVRWVDDTDFAQYKCPSLGPRHLRGFEMFTIGDCQSILLKLANERCVELRSALNLATARQIEAEELMKEEPDPADGMMTDAEMTYLTTMEEVKDISHKLVIAEKAFTFVRDRIEKLVAKYEALLVRFANDTESIAVSSVVSCESSYYSDGSYGSEEEHERDRLARRAERAELRAELAAREALLAKQQARAIRQEKERELHALQMRLHELQSESSAAITEREHSLVLARAITATRGQQKPVAHAAQRGGRINKSKIDDVKKRFRDRTAAKKHGGPARGYGSAPRSAADIALNTNRQEPRTAQEQARSNLYRMVGEEMFQHLDFYERSLKSVDAAR